MGGSEENGDLMIGRGRSGGYADARVGSGVRIGGGGQDG